MPLHRFAWLQLSIVIPTAMLCIGCSATNDLAQEPRGESSLVSSSDEQTPNVREKAVVAGYDHFPRFNRGTYAFNRALDRKLLRPVARGYDRIVPRKVQRRVRNFFRNLQAPIDIANNLLQGKFVDGFSDIGRFLFNSTAGLGGLFDPATRIGLERHEEDFGQTLAVWGVPSGSYLMLPVLGPGTVRDWAALAVDWRGDLLLRHDDTRTRNVLWVWRLIADRAALLPAERALDASFDEYDLVREAYLQNRAYEIRDGAPEDADYLYLDEDP